MNERELIRVLMAEHKAMKAIDEHVDDCDDGTAVITYINGVTAVVDELLEEVRKP